MEFFSDGGLPIDAALRGGAAARRVADAFLAGYRAALAALVPDLPAGRQVCLCATEAGGAHPRAIATRLDGGRITGEKKWVTGGPLADLLLVVVSTGSDDAGRNQLKLVAVDAHAPGVTLVPMPDTPFVPEIPHAALRFDGAPVARVLDGDGYADYLKPFRTVEDCHVFAAVLAYLFGVARRAEWPAELCQQLAALLASLRGLALAPPLDPRTHIALAGAIALGRRLIVESAGEWARADADERARWQRDVVLLDVADRARSARTAAAWQALR